MARALPLTFDVTATISPYFRHALDVMREQAEAAQQAVDALRDAIAAMTEAFPADEEQP